MLAPPRCTNTSFSLVEIVVAMGILMFALVSAMTVIGVSARQQRESTEVANARSRLSAEIAAMRAVLHEAVLDKDTRGQQFVNTINMIQTYPAGPLGPGEANTGVFTDTITFQLYERGPQATLQKWCWTNETTAMASMSLTGLDVNADGLGDGTNWTAEDLRYLPVKMRLTWIPATATTKDGSQDITVEIEALIY